MFLRKGDRVRGVISGKYLGIVDIAFADEAIITGPDGNSFSMAKSLIERIPEFGEGIPESRIWV